LPQAETMEWNWDNDICLGKKPVPCRHHHAGHSQARFLSIIVFQGVYQNLARVIKGNSRAATAPRWWIGNGFR
jgi:hypothetical protein